MRISVLHHGFEVDGGGERVTMSLLRALDRTDHDVVLRCVHPPRSASFCGQIPAAGQPDRGGGARGTGAGAASADPPLHEFRRVRLLQVSPGVGGHSPPGFASEIRSLFADTDSDLLVVTDGGFVMERTDASHVLLYTNSDLSNVHLAPSLGHLRRPFRLVRIVRAQPEFRRKIALIRGERVSVIPNSESTARAYEREVGQGNIEAVVYPPVDLGRFAAMRRFPKERRVATTGRFSPEKRHQAAVRVMRNVGARWDAVGNARTDLHARYLQKLKGMAGPDMHFHVNASEGELNRILGGAAVYLHPRPESFGIAVVEAVAAGCIPVVPDNSAHRETVPFEALRYGSTAEGAAAVRAALDGRYDGLRPKLQAHAQKFSEEAFQAGMLKVIEKHGP